MRALIFKGPYEFSQEDIPRPEPDDGEVLVRVRAVGACGSDTHGFSGKTGRRHPGMVMGHEIAGTVEAGGKNVTGLEKGMHVVIQPIIYCGECEMCRRGRTSVCLNKKMIGVNMGTMGGLSEFVVLPARNVFPISASVPFSEATLAEPLAVGMGAVSQSGIKEGDTVAIVGAGMIGLSVCMAARLHKPSRIFMVDISEKKLAAAEALGAVPVDSRAGDPVEAIQKMTGGSGTDLTFEAVGITSTVRTAGAVTKTGGTIVWVGNSQRIVEVDMQDIVVLAKRIQGIYCYNDRDFRAAVDLLERETGNLRRFVEKEVEMQDAQKLFTALAGGEVDFFRGVVMM